MGEVNQYSAMCRCCLQAGTDYQDLLNPAQNQLFLDVTGIKVESEHYGPKKICPKCYSALSSADEFLKLVHGASKVIAKWSTDVKVEPVREVKQEVKHQEEEEEVEDEKPEEEDDDEEIEYEDDGPNWNEDALSVELTVTPEKRKRGRPRTKPPKEPKIRKKKPVVFSCKVCRLQFQSKEESLAHHKIMHRVITNPPRDNQQHEYMLMILVYHHNDENVKPHMKNDVRFACCTCPEMFKEIPEIQEHISTAHDKKQDEEQRLKRVYRCTDCTFHSWCYRKTVAHMRVHSGLLPYQCDVCGKCFRVQCTLDDHLRMHAGTKQYPCSKCEKSFTRSGDRYNHVNTVHKPKSVACPICDKKFSRTSFMNRHLRFHTGEKPFSCDLCDKRFSFRSKLNQHVKEHSGITYDCEICGKPFKAEQHLRRHIASIHNDDIYTCPACGKSYQQKKTLIEHLKIHGIEFENSMHSRKPH